MTPLLALRIDLTKDWSTDAKAEYFDHYEYGDWLPTDEDVARAREFLKEHRTRRERAQDHAQKKVRPQDRPKDGQS